MFTQVVTSLLATMATVPIPLCYGIIAVWIGLDNAGIPAPMEPVLLFAGALATTGHIVLFLDVASATLGALLFASLAYVVGQRFGGDVIMRAGRHVGLTSARADHIELWLRKRGIVGVVIATVCPILRTFSAYVMGVAQVPLRRFVPGMLLAALAYSTLWILLGWVLGDNYRAPLRYLDSVGLVGALALAVVVAAVLLMHHFWGRLALRQVALHFHRHQA